MCNLTLLWRQRFSGFTAGHLPPVSRWRPHNRSVFHPKHEQKIQNNPVVWNLQSQAINPFSCCRKFTRGEPLLIKFPIFMIKSDQHLLGRKLAMETLMHARHRALCKNNKKGSIDWAGPCGFQDQLNPYLPKIRGHNRPRFLIPQESGPCRLQTTDTWFVFKSTHDAPHGSGT